MTLYTYFSLGSIEYLSFLADSPSAVKLALPFFGALANIAGRIIPNNPNNPYPYRISLTWIPQLDRVLALNVLARMKNFIGMIEPPKAN